MLIRLWNFLLIFTLLGLVLPSSAQDNSALFKQKDFQTNELSLNEFIDQIEKEYQVGFNYSNLPKATIPAKNYRSATLAYVLEDVLRDFYWYYELVGDKSIILQPLDRRKRGKYSISGIVINSESGSGMESVTVYANDESVSVTTNSIGYFQLNLNYLPQKLLLYSPSFSFKSIVTTHQSTWLFAEMDPDQSLEEVIVKGVTDSSSVNLHLNTTSIDLPAISEIPSALSTSGVVNALKYSAGFQSAVEANNAMIVRGGNNDQNLVLYDGVPVYNPLHVPGWFSIFNKNSVSKLNFIKGGIPAKFGGRLSSVIQSEAKQGNLKKWHGSLNVSPFAGEATIEGPLVKDKLSFIASGRRTFTDFLVSTVQNVLLPDNDNDFNLYFFDLNMGLHYQVNPRSSLDFVGYFGGDRGYIRSESNVSGARSINERNNNELLWSNTLASLTYRTLIGDRLVSKFSGKYSKYGFDYQNNYSIRISDEQSDFERQNEVSHNDGITDLRLVTDFSYHMFSNFQVDFGAGAINYAFVPANTQHTQRVNDEFLVDTSLVSSEIKANEQFAYTELKWNRELSTIQAGFRLVRFSSDKDYVYVEPRIRWGYYPTKNISFQASYNLLRQNVFSVTANEPGITYSIWLPVTGDIDPLKVQQVELGMQYLVKNGPTINLAGYYKWLNELPDFQTNIVDFITDKELTIGTGEARGIEFSAQQKMKSFSYWVSYTWSKSQRQFDEINDGKVFPFRFDRRHDASVVASWKLNKKWTMGLTWIYNSGNFVTLPVSRVIVKIEDELFLIENFGDRNNFQLPDYHRMDIGFSNVKKKKRGQRTWTFTLYNVYNQHNPYYVNLSFDVEGTPVLQQVNLLPFLPSVQYAFRF